MFRNVLLFITFILLISCNGQETTGYKTISIDYNHPEPLNVSQLFTGVKVCPLETTDENIMGYISKITMYNGLYYILDETNNCIFVYDSTGKYINQLKKIGRGTDEYIQIHDVKVNQNGIFIVDYPQQSILQYSLDLSFIRRIRFDFSLTEFKLNNDDFLTYSLFGEGANTDNDYYFYLTTDMGDIKERLVKRENVKNRKYIFQSSNVFCFNSDSLFSPRHSNYIYSINSKDAVYKLDFKDQTFPEDKLNIHDYDIYSGSFPFIIREDLYQQGPFVFINYYYKLQRYTACYNTHTAEVVSCGKYINDIIPDFRFFPRWQHENYWIDCVDSYGMISDFPEVMEKSPQLKDLKETDNPVLIVYEMKSPEEFSF